MSMNNIYTPIVHCWILSLASILDLRSSDDICCVDMELSYTFIGYSLEIGWFVSPYLCVIFQLWLVHPSREDLQCLCIQMKNVAVDNKHPILFSNYFGLPWTVVLCY